MSAIYQERLEKAVAVAGAHAESEACRAFISLLTMLYEDAKERLVEQDNDELRGAAKQARALRDWLRNPKDSDPPTVG